MLERTHYYKLWCERIRVRPTTLERYKRELSIFDRFLTDIKGIQEGDFDIDNFYIDALGRTYPMDREIIEEFVEYLEDEYADRPSVPQNCFSAVKSFFSTLKKNGIIQVDPTLNATGPKFYHSQRRISLTHEELQKLVEAAERKDPFTKRFVALVLVMAHAGLRNREVRFLTRDRVDFFHNLLIIDKGQKRAPGTVQMSPLLHATLKIYLDHDWWKRLASKSGAQYVFMAERGEMIKLEQLIAIVKKLANEAGIAKSVTPHVLRYTAATEMYRSGVHPAIIRRHLRHKNENTTLRYIHPTSKEDREALENFSMKGVLEGVCAAFKRDIKGRASLKRS
ncbi:tyrosine-type recombinase/integrase [Effusibacillus pohliae]|uniref:tyrosine-type recombinase/integrase n=1 Tax=Effusibacillus pohliae TaxID=232270 RepID=UPI000369BC35|nr:site-specific integrase [Effusibacillus pohliae]